jgi:hypothetical protein
MMTACKDKGASLTTISLFSYQLICKHALVLSPTAERALSETWIKRASQCRQIQHSKTLTWRK